MKTPHLIASLALAAAAALPAVAKPAPPPVCGVGDLAGVVVLDCTGYVTGNLFNQKPSNLETVADMLGGLGLAGQDGSWIEHLEHLSGSTIAFATPLYGVTYIGLHKGAAGEGGQGSALYKIDAGSAGITSLTFNLHGVANGALYATQPPVPEPGAAILLLAGLGVIAMVVKRRSQR
jgi:hypothetical protein